MDCEHDSSDKEEPSNLNKKIIMHPLYLPKMSPWFDLRVFYVRVSNFDADGSTPDHLTVTHTPLTPDTVLEVNGRRSSIYSECVSCSLRRDRVDRNHEEATFVSTDSIKMTGSVKFEVSDRSDVLLSGVLVLSNGYGLSGETRSQCKKWSMKCQPVMSACAGFRKSKQYMNPEMPSPTIEVYVAGCFSGTPIILTETLQATFRKKQHIKSTLDSIPEYETDASMGHPAVESLGISNYDGYGPENDVDVDYNSVYPRSDYLDGEGGELSWFNAGVRVGVGIGLGICVGLGIGVGLLVRTYQATTGNFKRRLI